MRVRAGRTVGRHHHEPAARVSERPRKRTTGREAVIRVVGRVHHENGERPLGPHFAAFRVVVCANVAAKVARIVVTDQLQEVVHPELEIVRPPIDRLHECPHRRIRIGVVVGEAERVRHRRRHVRQRLLPPLHGRLDLRLHGRDRIDVPVLRIRIRVDAGRSGAAVRLHQHHRDRHLSQKELARVVGESPKGVQRHQGPLFEPLASETPKMRAATKSYSTKSVFTRGVATRGVLTRGVLTRGAAMRNAIGQRSRVRACRFGTNNARIATHFLPPLGFADRRLPST